jgi:hypothetical protein
MKYGIEEQLHPEAADLVNRFSVALRAKLYAAQRKYGYADDWKRDDIEGMRTALLEHVLKGDPLDVAAYCAFLWDRNATAIMGDKSPLSPRERERRMAAYFKASRELDPEL